MNYEPQTVEGRYLAKARERGWFGKEMNHLEQGVYAFQRPRPRDLQWAYNLIECFKHGFGRGHRRGRLGWDVPVEAFRTEAPNAAVNTFIQYLQRESIRIRQSFADPLGRLAEPPTDRTQRWAAIDLARPESERSQLTVWDGRQWRQITLTPLPGSYEAGTAVTPTEVKR